MKLISFIKVLIPVLLILISIALYGRYDERVREIEYKTAGLIHTSAIVTELPEDTKGFKEKTYKVTFEDEYAEKYVADFTTREKLLTGAEVELYWSRTVDQDGVETWQYYYPIRKYERNFLMVTSVCLALIGLTGIILAFGIKKTAVEE